jgi:hypothetical protein
MTNTTPIIIAFTKNQSLPLESEIIAAAKRNVMVSPLAAFT